MKLTKRKSLELTIELWDWLAANPKRWKINWPGWKIRGGPNPEMRHDCPCCEYDLQHEGSGYADDGCPHCPLQDYWPSGSCEPEDGSGSPWSDWIKATGGSVMIKEAEKAATEITDLARQALADHNKRYPIQKSTEGAIC